MRPTVTVPLGAASVHLIAYDDILRNQAIEYVRGDNKAVGLRTERLVIPAKGSKTLEWTVMALPGNDEFDMVNRVRADWGVPVQQLDGPVTHNIFMFDKSMTEDDWRAFGARTNLRAIICAGGWVDERKPEPHIVGFGTGLATDYFADWRARFTEQTAMLHRACAGHQSHALQPLLSAGPRPRCVSRFLGHEGRRLVSKVPHWCANGFAHRDQPLWRCHEEHDERPAHRDGSGWFYAR
jgi:hypothetical protein